MISSYFIDILCDYESFMNFIQFHIIQKGTIKFLQKNLYIYEKCMQKGIIQHFHDYLKTKYQIMNSN